MSSLYQEVTEIEEKMSSDPDKMDLVISLLSSVKTELEEIRKCTDLLKNSLEDDN